MVKVVAGVIERDGKVFIVRRMKGDKLGNKWEFPGGKLESGETPEEALRRELREELDVETEVGAFICSSTYEYPHITVELLAYRVRLLSGEITLHVHDASLWVAPGGLDAFDFPAANQAIIGELKKKGVKGK